MKTPLLPFVCLLALIFNPAQAESDSYQSVNLALTQQSQSFDFEDVEHSLNLQGFRLGYLYGINQWSLGMDYYQASDSGGQSRPIKNGGFNLTSENSGLSFFAQYNWDHSWLGLAYSDSHNEHHYRFSNGNIITEVEDSDVDYRSSTLDTGYLVPTGSGQWVLSASLTHQLIKEFSHNVVNGSAQIQDNLNQSLIINEKGVLASMGLHYGHYLGINDTWQLYLNAGLYRQVVLDGEARTQPSRRSQTNTARNESSLSQDVSQSNSTSQQLQISLLHNQGSINFNVDKLSDQNISQAYYSVGFGINF